MSNIVNRKKIKLNLLWQDNSLTYLAVFSILFGSFIRIVQYASDRSLWPDEAWLATNIIQRSYLDLLQRLDHHQAAPVGFLWVEKLITQLLGSSEYALRLFPLMAGIASLVAMYYLGRQILSQLALPIALILLACLKFPLYYSTELKQYSSDVLIALLICLVLLSLRGQQLSKKRVLLLGCLEMMAILFSHTAIFVIGGIEVALLITTPKLNRKVLFQNRLPAYCIWLISFSAVYFFITAKTTTNQTLQSAWAPEYPTSVFDLVWLLDSLGRFFANPLGFPGITDAIAIFAFILGCIAFWKKDKAMVLVLLSPVITTLVATYLHKYPFRTRLILFLTPFFILLIAEGVAYFWERIRKHRSAVIVTALVIATLTVPSITRASSFILYPETRHEVRPVIEYIKKHQNPGDVIYADGPLTAAQVRYYAPRYGYSQSEWIMGDGDSILRWEEFRQQYRQLQPQRRVWFIFTGMDHPTATQIKSQLDSLGQVQDYHEQPRALTYLYQLK